MVVKTCPAKENLLARLFGGQGSEHGEHSTVWNAAQGDPVVMENGKDQSKIAGSPGQAAVPPWWRMCPLSLSWCPPQPHHHHQHFWLVYHSPCPSFSQLVLSWVWAWFPLSSVICEAALFSWPGSWLMFVAAAGRGDVPSVSAAQL